MTFREIQECFQSIGWQDSLLWVFTKGVRRTSYSDGENVRTVYYRRYRGIYTKGYHNGFSFASYQSKI